MPGKEALFRPLPFKRLLAAFTFAEYELTYLTINECQLLALFFSQQRVNPLHNCKVYCRLDQMANAVNGGFVLIVNLCR